MFPEQNHNQLPTPQNHPNFTPHAQTRPTMHYADSLPHNEAVQQNPNGQYEVVPPVNNASGASGHNPYEFIVAPSAPKRGSFDLGGGSFGKRIGLFVSFAAVILIVVMVVFSMLKPKSNTPQLIAIAQRQQEIIRIATAASKQVGSQDASDFVGNTTISVTSDQQQLIAYLKSHGTKLSPKTLALDQSAQTDTLLTNAASANNYDSVVTQVLTTQLQSYGTQVRAAYNISTTGPIAKKLLQQSFTSAAALLDESKSVPTSN